MRISTPMAAMMAAACAVSGPLTGLGAVGADRYPGADLWLELMAAGVGTAVLLIPVLVVIGAVAGRHQAVGGVSLTAAIGAALLASAGVAAIFWGWVGPDRPWWAEMGLLASVILAPLLLPLSWRHRLPPASRNDHQL